MKRYKIKTNQGEIIADLVQSGPIMVLEHDGGKIEIDWLLFCDLFSIGGIVEVQP